jgi:hypothetical protein
MPGKEESRIIIEKEIIQMEKNQRFGKIIINFENGKMQSVHTETITRIIKTGKCDNVNKII